MQLKHCAVPLALVGSYDFPEESEQRKMKGGEAGALSVKQGTCVAEVACQLKLLRRLASHRVLPLSACAPAFGYGKAAVQAGRYFTERQGCCAEACSSVVSQLARLPFPYKSVLHGCLEHAGRMSQLLAGCSALDR